MDPIETISISLALGAGALASKELISLAVKDAYSSLKDALRGRRMSFSFERLEQKPGSADLRGELENELRKNEAENDTNLLDKSRNLIELILKDAPEAARVVGVKLSDISSTNARLRNIVSAGDGVSIERSKFQGDIEIDGVRAGVPTTKHKN
ncbi:hypothetical protein [Methylobacterium sp. GC_Met_2]|uniref:hypothetical protein n=1 Tax=Methylobacterium sp. GC_Met_2 TaxID=2937376 RepID=UPI00226B9BF6|nr:hypothetical protein [Methylobacterium sp. GC_Met_2]